MIETSSQRRREIAGGPGFEAGDDAAPLAGDERYRRLADAEMTIRRVEAAFGLHRQSKVPIPIALGYDVAAGRPNGQGKKSGIGEQKTFPCRANVRAKLPTDVVP